jgi:hypothetical protein
MVCRVSDRWSRAIAVTSHRHFAGLPFDPGTNYVASPYAVNPLGLEFLEKPFHTVLIVLKD